MGFVFGKWRARRQALGRNLEQFDFYPFIVDTDGFPQFNLQLFEKGVEYLLKKLQPHTPRQKLIVIGEQNSVRYHLEPWPLAQYEKLYAHYDGQGLLRG